jgi:hypothetical protein
MGSLQELAKGKQLQGQLTRRPESCPEWRGVVLKLIVLKRN